MFQGVRTIVLNGEKCKLRPLELSDVKEIVKHINDLELKEYLSTIFPFNEALETEWIKSLSSKKNEVHFGIEFDGNLVGTTGLRDIDFVSKHAEFGIMIFNKDYWNKGIGTEATKLILKYSFEILGLHRIMLKVFESNTRAFKVYEKCGFKVEGRERQAVQRKGKFEDFIVMSILEQEYYKIYSGG